MTVVHVPDAERAGHPSLCFVASPEFVRCTFARGHTGRHSWQPPDQPAPRRTVMVELGSTVKDRITGFTGVVVGRVQYLTGCNQVLVAPPVKDDGTFRESAWFDEQRVAVGDAPVISLDNGETPGFDAPAPRR